MNLRQKLLFGIGIVLIVTFTLVAVFSYFSQEQSYRMLEEQAVHRALESVVSSFENDLKHTNSITRDLAARPDTYRFAQGQNPGWIDQNMAKDYFTRFDVDYVLVFNNTNQLVFARGYNPGSGMFEEVPVFLVSDIENRNNARDIVNSTKGTSGILDSPGGFFILSSHPVLNDNFEGPSAGSLQILRRIDSQYLTDLTARAGYSVIIIPSQESADNSPLTSIVSRITPSTPIVVIPENDDSVAGYIQVDDMQNPGGFYVKVTEPRTIYHAGRDTIAVFLLSLFGAGIFIILFVLLFIDRIVLSRLNSIISNVRKNKESGNINGADGDRRDDELARLAQEIDPVFSELTMSRTEHRESEERYRTLINKLPDYVIIHREGILVYVNPAVVAHLGYDAKNLIGKSVFPFIAPEYHDTVRGAMARQKEGTDSPPYEIKIVAGNGTHRSVLVNSAEIKYEGKPASLNVLTDIVSLNRGEEAIRFPNEDLEQRVEERTEALIHANEELIAEIRARARAEQEITRSLEEKDLLLREIHHRVKNNLQIISSLLKLQSRYITDPNVLESIKDSQSRVRAMALVHERIYRSHNIAEVNLKEYLNYLTTQIIQFYQPDPHRIEITVAMDDIMVDIDTIIPVGLIMNELVSNSLKHAFSDGRTGIISIEGISFGSEGFRFIYHDSGAGMPAGFDWENTESLGLRLVNSLVDQLNGTIVLGTGEGTTFIIDIRKSPAENVG